jgi:hypothetical protein
LSHLNLPRWDLLAVLRGNFIFLLFRRLFLFAILPHAVCLVLLSDRIRAAVRPASVDLHNNRHLVSLSYLPLRVCSRPRSLGGGAPLITDLDVLMYGAARLESARGCTSTFLNLEAWLIPRERLRDHHGRRNH